MAIILNTAGIDKLVTILQNPRKEHREVVYFGVGEAIVAKILSCTTIENGIVTDKVKMERRLTNVLDYLGEVAIIERSELESITRRILKYNLNKTSFVQRLGSWGAWTCLNDVLGISECYSAPEIFAINRYFSVYREALVHMLTMLNNYDRLVDIFRDDVVE